MARFQKDDLVTVINVDHPFFEHRGRVTGVLPSKRHYRVNVAVFAHLERPQAGIHSLQLLIPITVRSKDLKKVKG